jgi:hypothetical protein
MRYNKYTNIMEPDTIKLLSRCFGVPRREMCPSLVRPLPLLLYPLKQCALDPLTSDEETLAHKQAVVCYLHAESDKSAILQV